MDTGAVDLPFLLDKVKEVSGQPKVTYIGYALGNTELTAGLSQKLEYFQGTLNKAIFLAPCLYYATLGYENYKEVYGAYDV